MSFRATHLFAALALWPSILTTAELLPIAVNQPYSVAVNTAKLTDVNRLDPYAKDGRLRSVMVSSFSPIASCRNKRLEPYMPPATTAHQEEKFGAYGVPNGTFYSLQVESCKESANISGCSDTLPFVIFSGALGTSRLIYTNMLQNVAAAGYMVISVDHPYDADIVEFPDGTIATGIDIDDSMVEATLNTRAEDIAFVWKQMVNASITDRLFPGQLKKNVVPRTAVIGHSLGGAAAATTMFMFNKKDGGPFEAGLNIDGTVFGDVVEAGLNRPFMLIGHENKTQETDPSWKSIWPKLNGWKSELEVLGSAHYSFSDLPYISSVLGFQDKLPVQVAQVLGTVDGHRMANLTAAYTTAFLDMIFKSGSEDMLMYNSTEFPEVIKVA